ncbi:MAG: hypothetical protein ABSG01_15030 [Anaerolineales bacterium]|jgi:hypothetical protein
MNRYLVESTHTAEDCHHVVEQFVYHGHVMNFEWGCNAGIHTAWAMLESENEAEALLSVPPHLRSKARAIQLTKYTPEKLQKAHE